MSCCAGVAAEGGGVCQEVQHALVTAAVECGPCVPGCHVERALATVTGPETGLPPARIASQEEVACRYWLEVQTSDVRRAGTSGSVFATLIGDAGTIGGELQCSRTRLPAPPCPQLCFGRMLRGLRTAAQQCLPPSRTLPPAGPYQLSNAEAEHFQRGQLDVFEIEGAPDCGRLQQIEVGVGAGGDYG